MNYLLHFTWNIQISPLINRKITKLMPAINELSVTTYFSMLRTKTNLVRGDFGSPVNRWIFVRKFKNSSDLWGKQNAKLFFNLYSEQINWKKKPSMKKQENLQNDKFLYLFLNRVYPLRNKDTLASKELDTAFYKFEWAAWIQKIGFRKCGNKIMKL